MDFVIAVDGTAASGKGTLAAMLAADYRLPHLDTGLLYRAVGLAVRDAGVNPDDPVKTRTIALSLETLPGSGSPELLTGAAGEYASRVAAHPGVRAVLLQFQKDFADRPGGAVLDGRDIGTVIAPDAPAKLYVDAALEIRAQRRWLQTSAKGDPRTVDEMILDLRRRDARDSERAAAPLMRAQDAPLLDTTQMSISQAADAARRIVEAARIRWLDTQRSG